MSPPSVGGHCSGEGGITITKEIILLQQPSIIFARDDYLGSFKTILYTYLGSPETPLANTNELPQRMKGSLLAPEGKYINHLSTSSDPLFYVPFWFLHCINQYMYISLRLCFTHCLRTSARKCSIRWIFFKLLLHKDNE